MLGTVWEDFLAAWVFLATSPPFDDQSLAVHRGGQQRPHKLAKSMKSGVPKLKKHPQLAGSHCRRWTPPAAPTSGDGGNLVVQKGPCRSPTVEEQRNCKLKKQRSGNRGAADGRNKRSIPPACSSRSAGTRRTSSQSKQNVLLGYGEIPRWKKVIKQYHRRAEKYCQME